MIEWIVSSCVLILLALLVRALLKNSLSARLRYALWALVLVRLLVPVTPVNSPLSLWNLVQSAEPAAYAPVDDPAPPGNWSGGGMSDPSESSAARSDSLPQAGPAWEAAPVDRTSPGQQPGPALSPARILTALWLGGAAALALILLWSNLSFLRRLRRSRKPLVADCLLPVYTAAVPSPCLFGPFRPAVYLDEDTARDDKALPLVLAHEYTHFRQGDHLWSILRGTCLVLHWYNPLVWLAARLSRRDGELACDEGTVRRLGEDCRADYGRTLVALATAAPKPADLLCLATSLNPGKGVLRERVLRLAQATPTKKAAAVALALACFLAAGAACTGAEERAHDEQVSKVSDGEQSQSAQEEQPPLTGSRRRGVYTFLLAGVDDMERTDTVMVASYDTINQSAALMSLPRETMVNAPWDIKNLGSVYGVCGGGELGLEALKDYVADLVGFTPDFTILLEWEAVGELVDELGGVWFDVPYDLNYDDPAQNLSIHQAAGRRLLSGQDAMEVVRWRHNNNGSTQPTDGSDLSRTQIQRDFLAAVLEQFGALDRATKLTALAQVCADCLNTDLTFGNLLWFARQTAQGGLTADDLYLCSMPCTPVSVYSRTLGNRMTYVTPNADELITLVNQRFNPYQADLLPEDLDLMWVDADGNLHSSSGVLLDSGD